MPSQQRRILVIDDEPDLSELLAYNLEQQGHRVNIAASGLDALQSAKADPPDLIVLDVMMPEMDGYEVARRLRQMPSAEHTPIIMLTAKTGEQSEFDGLDAGADDFVTKPYSLRILIARIESLLRRRDEQSAVNAAHTLGPIHLDLDTHQASIDGNPMDLTVTEFKLLAALIGASGKVLARPALILRAMGPGVTITTRTIDVHITSIRKKLGHHARLIRTVRGVGYRAVEPDASKD